MTSPWTLRKCLLYDAAASEEDLKEQENQRRRELYKHKRFFCELCNKGFHQQHQLRKHVLRHVKPFPCTLCDKGFYQVWWGEKKSTYADTELHGMVHHFLQMAFLKV